MDVVSVDSGSWQKTQIHRANLAVSRVCTLETFPLARVAMNSVHYSASGVPTAAGLMESTLDLAQYI